MRNVGRVTTGLLLLALAFPAFARSVAQKKELARTQFEAAERMREELNGRPVEERTRRDYQRVTDAYRRVYYTAPTSIKADPAAVAVAELLAEAGRRFDDRTLLQAAIGQYEFLRREYPGSKFRVDALFTIGQIYKDELEDREQAKATFEEFLKRYPRTLLAGDARAALKELEQPAEKPEKKKAIKEKESEIRDAAAPPPKATGPSLVTGIRHWSTPDYTRVAIDLESSVEYQAGRVPSPDRIFFDLHNTKLSSTLLGKTFEVQDGFLTKIRVSQYQKDLTRVVLDVKEISDYSAFLLPNPYRLIIDIHGRQRAKKAPAPAQQSTAAQDAKDEGSKIPAKEPPAVATSATKARDKAQPERSTARATATAEKAPVSTEKLAAKTGDGTTSPLKPEEPVVRSASSPAHREPPVGAKEADDSSTIKRHEVVAAKAATPASPTEPKSGSLDPRLSPKPGERAGHPRDEGRAGTPERTKTAHEASGATPHQSEAAADSEPRPEQQKTARNGNRKPVESEPGVAAKPETRQERSKTARGESAGRQTLSQPAPGGATETVASKGADPKPIPELAKAPVDPGADTPKPRKDTEDVEVADTTVIARLNPPDLKTSKPTTAPTFEAIAPRSKSAQDKRRTATGIATHEARPTANGERSLIRALGLKIGKIVVDAGHGGHDTGTIGPNGLQEKDLTLDVALRLGKLLETKLGADVIYTRDDDTFIPLETRTAIANQNEADLFISVHANSSRDKDARGVETYYLNFTSSAEALEVAARENAVSEKSIHELQDLVKKIALKEKIEESREFASEVQRSLYGGLSPKSPAVRNRGVKKAPFIVLIGANMPSILAEISFLSNATDERKLQTPEYRQKVAEYLYRGITRYVGGLSGVKIAKR
jgi:N-acetylmuramoyl-L-alanine amidase